LRLDLRLLKSFKRGLSAHVARSLVLRGNSPFFDPGANRDTLIARIDDLREVVVGKALVRHVAAGAHDRNGPAPFNGVRPRARVRLSFHDNGGFPRRYAGSPVVQSTQPRPATHF